jgi:hypothetical protein
MFVHSLSFAKFDETIPNNSVMHGLGYAHVLLKKY